MTAEVSLILGPSLGLGENSLVVASGANSSALLLGATTPYRGFSGSASLKHLFPCFTNVKSSACSSVGSGQCSPKCLLENRQAQGQNLRLRNRSVLLVDATTSHNYETLRLYLGAVKLSLLLSILLPCIPFVRRVQFLGPSSFHGTPFLRDRYGWIDQ